MFDDAAVAGIGETAKHRPRSVDDDDYRSIEEYLARAATLTLADAGLAKDDVDGLAVANPVVDTPFIYPSVVAEQLGFRVDWLGSADHGGTNAVSMVTQAALAVEAGLAETVLCLAADTPLDPATEGFFPPDPRGPQANYADPFGMQGPNAHFALAQRAHMDEFGTTLDHLGAVAVAQREHATRNPLAYFDDPISLADYRESRVLADPVRLYDCVVPVNGGFGVLVTRRERAASLDQTPVALCGVGESHTFGDDQRPPLTTTGVADAGPRACEAAGVDPADADFFQLYDDDPVVVTMQLEDLGLCPKGGGGPFVADADLSFDGDVPLNTGGGQLSAGQAGLAGGFVQFVEAVRQLRGEGGDRQVPGAEWGLVSGVSGVAFGATLRSAAVAVLEVAG